MTVVYGSGYVRSVLGICKLVELIFLVVAIILTAIDGRKNELIKCFEGGIVVGIVVSTIIFFLCVTKLGKYVEGVLLYQHILLFILFIYLVIVSSILISQLYGNLFIAGGEFGLISAIVFLIDALVCYNSFWYSALQ
ncbi:uncharacterized protein LOC132696510 isoform X3 [Cylas formicarius]|uniref:uncharacterized protein LOC132696510 isoform X3 n=1 Tax=Cylas formicarius TaxID=197179 RepID=UPI002958568B|nr:uncharacterized protein LOC132696510 isoform X3 [Cylas formicarius]